MLMYYTICTNTNTVETFMSKDTSRVSPDTSRASTQPDTHRESQWGVEGHGGFVEGEQAQILKSRTTGTFV